MNKKEIIEYLKSEDTAELFARADAVRREHCGDGVYLRAIIEFSNYCDRNCLYCGLRKSNEKLHRYRMSLEEIFEAALTAKHLGYGTVVLQSGEETGFSTSKIRRLIEKIKSELSLAVTLSIGEKSRQEYQAFRAAGADRYLLKFETSNEKLFKQLKPDSVYAERFRCLDDLRSLGFQVGSGFMVGLPGQTLEILADDLLACAQRDFDMIGIGPFIPHPETPLKGLEGGSAELALKVVALTRILTKNSHLPATTALASIDPVGRERALQAGANVIMPNVTPVKYKKDYEIYPGKICITDEAKDCRFCLEERIESVGRFVAEGPGHSLKKTAPAGQSL